MGGKINPVFDQTNFRGKDGDTTGLNTDSGWAAVLNAGWTQDTNITFRVRFEIDETATTTETASPGGQLEASYKGGIYFDVTSFSSYVYSSASTQFADEAATTDLLSGSGRAFDTGRGSHDGLVNNEPILSNEHTEYEYSIRIRGADVSDEDTITLRVKGLNNYTNTPTVTVNVPASPQTAPVAAADAGADAETVTRVPGGVARTVVEGSASGDSPVVSVLSAASRSVVAGDATGDAPSATAEPGVVSRTVVEATADGDAPAATAAPGAVVRTVDAADAGADAPSVAAFISITAVVAAATSDGDAPAASAVPGVAARSVVEGSTDADAPTADRIPGVASRSVVAGAATGDAPSADTLSESTLPVIAADADTDGPAVSRVPGIVARLVTEGSATSDTPEATASTDASGQTAVVTEATADSAAPAATVLAGAVARSVVAADSDSDVPAATAVPGEVSRTVVEGSAVGDTPAIVLAPGVAARILVAATAFADVPLATAVSDQSIEVSAASAWAQDQLTFPENLLYQHFNVRGQQRGHAGFPKSTETTEVGQFMEEGVDEDVPILPENIRGGKAPRRK